MKELAPAPHQKHGFFVYVVMKGIIMTGDELRQIEWRDEQEQVWIAESERCYFIAHDWLQGELSHEEACCKITGNDNLFEYDDGLIYAEWIDMVRDADEQLLLYAEQVMEAVDWGFFD